MLHDIMVHFARKEIMRMKKFGSDWLYQYYRLRNVVDFLVRMYA